MRTAWTGPTQRGRAILSTRPRPPQNARPVANGSALGSARVRILAARAAPGGRARHYLGALLPQPAAATRGHCDGRRHANRAVAAGHAWRFQHCARAVDALLARIARLYARDEAGTLVSRAAPEPAAHRPPLRLPPALRLEGQPSARRPCHARTDAPPMWHSGLRRARTSAVSSSAAATAPSVSAAPPLSAACL